MQLAAFRPAKPLISLVPMIDVLLIMLIFFMVTSTYLNLDMIPVAERGAAPRALAPESDVAKGAAPPRILIRLGADNVAYVRGQAIDPTGLATLVRGRMAENAATEIIVLPSGNADTQALVSVMDAVVQAGGVRLRVVRLEGKR